MVIKKVVDIQIDYDTVKILCECTNNEYKVIEAHIDFNGIEINHERDIRDIGPDSFITKDKCDIIIPVKISDGNYIFNVRKWK